MYEGFKFNWELDLYKVLYIFLLIMVLFVFVFNFIDWFILFNVKNIWYGGCLFGFIIWYKVYLVGFFFLLGVLYILCIFFFLNWFFGLLF